MHTDQINVDIWYKLFQIVLLYIIHEAGVYIRITIYASALQYLLMPFYSIFWRTQYVYVTYTNTRRFFLRMHEYFFHLRNFYVCKTLDISAFPSSFRCPFDSRMKCILFTPTYASENIKNLRSHLVTYGRMFEILM